MNNTRILPFIVLLIGVAFSGFQSVNQNIMTWDKLVGKKKTAEAKKFLSVLAQSEEEKQLLSEVLNLLQETKIEKDDYTEMEMLTFVLHMTIDDPDMTEPFPVYIRVGKAIPEGADLEIPRADVDKIAKRFSWLSFSYSPDPIPFGNNQITWYGVDDKGRYYMSETFRYDSEWAMDNKWIAPIEVGSGQDQHIGLERVNPYNGWHLFENYLAEPKKMTNDHVGSILLRMIHSNIFNKGDVMGNF